MNTENKSNPSVQSVRSVKSVNTLESLVPPLELCRKIPKGAFADSALVYAVTKHSLNYCFGDRMCFINDYRELIPAPTLQEILSCIDAIIDVSVHFHHRGEFRFVWAKKLSNGQIVTQDNPATAALKLWLELNPPDQKSGEIK